MERCIEGRNNVLSIAFANLKSSMERFIASDVSSGNTSCKNLKFSMERFIVVNTMKNQ